MKKKYFPMFVDMSNKKILMVGGGNIAARRIETLLIFADDITVIAPDVCEKMSLLIEEGSIKWISRNWEESDTGGYDIILAATNNSLINSQVYDMAKEEDAPVNVADDKSKCDFFFPAIINKEELTIAIGTDGTNPKRTKDIKEKISEVL